MPIFNSDSLRRDFNNRLRIYGEPIRFRYFTPTIGGAGSYYDEPYPSGLARSGNDIWTSGIYFGLDITSSSFEPIKLEAGMLVQDDNRLFINGGIETSGTWRVGIGSPPRLEYAPVEPGIHTWSLNGSVAFKEIRIRVLVNGSLVGEN